MSAPATHKQPSRKGKKAWRKNVDLDTVTTGLEAAREQYTQTGGHLLTDANAADIFQTDTSGDTKIHKQVSKPKHTRLHADQVLGARSLVPTVPSRARPENLLSSASGTKRKRKQDEKISYAELDRLRALAYTSSTRRQHLDDKPADADHDPWAAPSTELLIQDPNTTYLETPKPIREPRTLREAPISQTASGRPVPHVQLPNAGRSYNPEFRDWQALLEKEGAKAVEAEKRRLAEVAEDEEREQRALTNAAEIDRKENQDGGFSDYESEWEGFVSDGGDAGKDSNSLNAKRPGRKTPMERKKIERRKKAEALQRHQEQLRKRAMQENQMAAIVRAAKAENQARAMQEWEGFGSDMSDDDDDGGHDGTGEAVMPRRPRFGKRFAPPEAPLELVLPDELQDSLRLLKPEGNLLKDRYRNAIVQGRIEARKPVMPHAARNRKATEKWSYKDWKLPSQT